MTIQQLLILSAPPPVSPVSGMNAWYRSDTVVLTGSSVSAWTDKSGNGLTMSEITLGRDPIYSASDANFNNQASLLGSNVAGTTLRAASALSSFVSASAYTIYAVIRPTSYGTADTGPGANWKTYLGDRNQVLSVGIGSSQALVDNFDGADKITGGAVSLNITYGIEATLSGGTLSHRISGAAPTTVAAGNLSGGLTGVLELFYGDGTLAYDGYAAEFIIYNSALSAANLALNRSYLGARYAVTW